MFDLSNVLRTNSTTTPKNIKCIVNSLLFSFSYASHKKQVKDIRVNSDYCIKQFLTTFSNHEKKVPSSNSCIKCKSDKKPPRVLFIRHNLQSLLLQIHIISYSNSFLMLHIWGHWRDQRAIWVRPTNPITMCGVHMRWTMVMIKRSWQRGLRIVTWVLIIRVGQGVRVRVRIRVLRWVWSLQLRIHIDSPEVQAGAPEDVGSGDSLVFSGRLNYFPRYPYAFFKISNLEFSTPKL